MLLPPSEAPAFDALATIPASVPVVALRIDPWSMKKTTSFVGYLPEVPSGHRRPMAPLAYL